MLQRVVQTDHFASEASGRGGRVSPRPPPLESVQERIQHLRRRTEYVGSDGGPIERAVKFYLPDNGRSRPPEEYTDAEEVAELPPPEVPEPNCSATNNCTRLTPRRFSRSQTTGDRSETLRETHPEPQRSDRPQHDQESRRDARGGRMFVWLRVGTPSRPPSRPRQWLGKPCLQARTQGPAL